MKLTNETTALLSNALIAFGQDQDIQRQRLILSAVGAFDQYDNRHHHTVGPAAEPVLIRLSYFASGRVHLAVLLGGGDRGKR